MQFSSKKFFFSFVPVPNCLSKPFQWIESYAASKHQGYQHYSISAFIQSSNWKFAYFNPIFSDFYSVSMQCVRNYFALFPSLPSSDTTSVDLYRMDRGLYMSNNASEWMELSMFQCFNLSIFHILQITYDVNNVQMFIEHWTRIITATQCENVTSILCDEFEPKYQWKWLQ